MKNIPILLLLLSFNVAAVLGQTRIIDMHIHSYDNEYFKKPLVDYYGNKGSKNADEHFNDTYSALKKYNIVKAVVSGSVSSVDKWKSKDVDNRIIRGFYTNHPDDTGLSISEVEELMKKGKIDVFGEIGAYYSGTTLNDSIWQPYLRLCVKYDIPVCVHTGGGDPGGAYTWSPKARLTLSDPFLIEDVLVRYPKLRIYLMHSGEVWHENALRLMSYYPQVYSDLGAMLWVEPITKRYIVEFLKNAKHDGYIDRVMYGTDQMDWPYAIEESIKFLNSLDFLTDKEKQDIYYHNAARFLRLEE